jgi:nucleoside-diphosphate-sugar epimerase
MRFLVTGASGFLGSRFATLLAERGHDVVAARRPGGRPRAAQLEAVEVDAGDRAIRDLIRGCDAVLHFAGVPDPTKAIIDPARAVRENAGTTLNLLEGCGEHGAGLVYPSTVRATVEPPPDAYAISKRLGEEVCRTHGARATVVRLTSVFGIGQVAWEGATGAIACFAAAALEGDRIAVFGDPYRKRDFVYADDIVPAVERLVSDGRWNETFTLASGSGTTLREAAELVRTIVGSRAPIETGRGTLPPGENESYVVEPDPRLGFEARPLEEAIDAYVQWLRRHPLAQGRARA